MQRVQELLGISRTTITQLVNAGFVTPSRGPRNEHLFSFQDLMLLRTAHALQKGKVPPKKIVRSLERLKQTLPAELPLTGLRLTAVDSNVVVSDRLGRWEADSGQFLMDFEVTTVGGDVAFLSPSDARAEGRGSDAEGIDPSALFDRALALEPRDATAAEAAYRELIERIPTHVDAYLNLGTLLCAAGRHDDAMMLYDAALARVPDAASLHFNRAIALEDQQRFDEAAAGYGRALALDPDLADAHFNLGHLRERLGDPRGALRHLSAYRKLRR